MPTVGTLTQAKKENQTIDIRPTLLIGLGGTGKEVLRRLRRMFYEKYRVAGLPIMEYLWFDTDIRNQSLSGEVPDELDRRIDLTAPQKIDGRVQPEELAGYRLNKNAYPHIWDWLPSELDALPDNAITQGAGQIRSFGRLAFFHHYARIRDAIDRLGSKVTAQEAVEDMNRDYPDYTVDNSTLEIITVSSLGGGTGSGCFIDVGFLCRVLFPTSTRTAFLAMPTVFDGKVGSTGVEAVHANGFAALKELEYFMQPRFIATIDEETSEYSTHEFNWDGTPRQVEAPPFSTVYMLDKENRAGERIDEFTDTFQMIAEFLLLDFDRTRFAAQKRSVRSNMEQYLQNMATFKSDDYIQYFPCRYASFGLSQIELNQPRLANAAANRCAQYLVDLIMAKDNRIPQGYDDADVKPRMEQMGLTKELFLQRCLVKPGKDFTLIDEVVNELIEPTFKELRDELYAAPAVEDQKVLDRQVEQTRQQVGELVRQVRERVGERLLQQGTQKGDGVTQILENIRLDRPKLEKRVEDECLELLCDPLNFGPKFMVEWLKIAVRELERIKEELQAKENQDIEAPEAPSREIEFSEDYEKYEALLKSAREEMPFAFLTKRIAINHYKGRKKQSLKQSAELITRNLVQQVKDVEKQLKEWVTARYEQEAARRLLNPNSGGQVQEKGLLDNTIGFVGQQTEVRGTDGELHVEFSGLLAKVEEFQKHLQDLASRFEGFHNSYRKRMPSVRNLSLMPELNYEEAIKKELEKRGLTGAGFKEILQDILRRYFRSEEAKPLFAEHANLEGTEIDAIRDCTRIIFNRSANKNNAPRDWEEVEDSLSQFAFDLFKEFYTDRNAVQELQNQKHNEKEEMQKRARLAEARMSKLKPAPQGMSNHTRNTIGLPPNEKRWEELVDQNVGGYKAEYHAPDSVIFVSQWMAFPLFAIENLRKLHAAYENNLRRMPQNVFRRYMTKDYIKYPEILPPRDDQEARMLVDALQPLIDGILLEIVTFDRRGFYRTYRAQGRKYTDDYGPNIEVARRRLARDRETRNRLRQAVQKIRDNWKSDGNGLVFEQYLALQSHLVDEVYPKRRVVIDGQSVNVDDLFHSLLSEASEENFKDVQKRLGISDSELDDRIGKHLQNKDGFAKPLDYSDPHCKDDIYVMDGANA
jgi:hypothetical protein